MGIEAVLALCLLPPAGDIHRFPSAKDARFCLNFNQEYLNNASNEQSFARHHWREWQDAIDEATHERACWDMLEDAWWSGSDDLRRERLGKLRSLLGNEAYMAGRMPPPVPLERFPYVGE